MLPVRAFAPATAGSESGLVRLLVVAVVLAFAAWGAWSWFGLSATSGGTAPAATPAEALQRELLRINAGRSGDPVLNTMYQSIDARHFAGALPDVSVRWEAGLARVGDLAARAFTLEGMFGHVGKRSVILLNPELRADRVALERALCHEMAHAYLYFAGDATTDHGPAFQAVLRRLSDEGAFEGILASDGERARLRAWLDAESTRLDTERQEMDRTGTDLERDRLDVERALLDLAGRADAAPAQGSGRPSEMEVAEVDSRRDAYNQRAADANARAARYRDDLNHFNTEVARYNLMLVYPDGIDELDLVTPKLPETPAGRATASPACRGCRQGTAG
jgi:SprT-like family